MSMKKVTACCLALLMISCLACKKTGEEPVEPATYTRRTRLVISGSATTTPVLEVLANEYSRLHPEVSIDFLPSSHTGGGIQGTHSGDLDLGAVSRALDEEESKLGLIFYEFARDGLVFVTNRNVPLANITTAQIKDIYAGRISRWMEIGVTPSTGTDIVVIDRPEHSSPKIVLREGLFSGDFSFGPNVVVVERALDANEALIKTLNSIGYTSLGAIKMEEMPLNIPSVNGVEASDEAINEGKYPFYRPLGIVYRPDAKAEVLAFVEFISSSEGKRIISEEGFIPSRTF